MEARRRGIADARDYSSQLKATNCTATHVKMPSLATVSPMAFPYKTSGPRYNLNQLRTIQRLWLMRDKTLAIG